MTRELERSYQEHLQLKHQLEGFRDKILESPDEEELEKRRIRS